MTMLSRLKLELGGVPLHGASIERIAREDLFAAYIREVRGPQSEWQIISQIKNVCGVGIVTAMRYRETLIQDGRLVPLKDGRGWLYQAGR